MTCVVAVGIGDLRDRGTGEDESGLHFAACMVLIGGETAVGGLGKGVW